MNKVLKVIRNILLVLVLLVVLALLACVLLQAVNRSKDKKVLTEHGLNNMVSAGNIELNLPVFGSETPDHTIVALPGSGDATFAPAMKAFAEYVSGNNRIVVVNRPGYGTSDVAKEDMTVEYVVECSRTALQNAGIEAPYVLMPHSLGGIYATYWLNTYPEEIEGVLFLASVYDPDEPMSTEPSSDAKTLNTLTNLGIIRLLFPLDENSGLCSMLPSAYKEDGLMLTEYRLFNRSLDSETALIDENNRKAWNSIRTTDIPKIYIYTDVRNEDDAEDQLRFLLGDDSDEITEDRILEGYALLTEGLTDAYLAKREEYCSKLGNCELVNIPASHFLYLHKPEETAAVLEMLLDRLN